ncbi:hypothetical protein KIN20_021519 [Parelaphostrongylus tenuis]|uniref:Uncharacterized protein n=1 Tax=Parelaphostrongylus tenuis TaxID=148309 RepID=A0AAD5MP11_PARTN|nr:hypothetical protein KIN20_004238 [Parelaphostrongylus tenuis]KAJ1362100.1 hypothetical protein KIN20_021519 [Parelaphostrongylus tenuis]
MQHKQYNDGTVANVSAGLSSSGLSCVKVFFLLLYNFHNKCFSAFLDHLIHPPAYTQNLSIWDTAIIRHRRQRSRKEHERGISDEHSRKLNKSYETLRNPCLRAKYLLNILREEKKCMY